MYGFLLKKSFCDGWDNLLSVIITNVILLFTLLGSLYLAALSAKLDNSLILAAIFILACVVISILTFAYGDCAAEIANFNGIGLADYFKAIPGCIKDGALFGLLVSIAAILSFFAFDYYYLQLNSLIGVFLGSIILWLDVFLMLSLQWFLPVRSLMHNDFKKCFKKCLIIFFDNTGFSILVGLHTLLSLVITVVFIGFIPGFAGILIHNTNALRLRLYKYDYLEKHPELKTRKERRAIPWEELIYEDRETLGPRKFKTFLFPWKDEER